MYNIKLITLLLLTFIFLPALVVGQPEVPVEKWTGKTILLVGAHPDDDAGRYGTLSLLQENGNEVYVLLLTTGNVGTKDPTMTRDRLSKIRRQEELNALAEIGIPADHYINLGYTDGMVEFADREEVVRRLVWHYRKIKPDVLFAWDPGHGYVRWHKTDHRAASYLSVDAARAAEWRLLFPGQIIHEGLEAHAIPEYMFYGGVEKDLNTWVDITGHVERKIKARSQHISQMSAAWENYTGPSPDDLKPEDRKEFMERMKKIPMREGKPMEGFRYYKGAPDGIGSGRR